MIRARCDGGVVGCGGRWRVRSLGPGMSTCWRCRVGESAAPGSGTGGLGIGEGREQHGAVFKFVLILLVGLFLEAIGVVLLSRGLKDIGEMERVSVGEVLRVVKAGASHPKLLLGVAFEAAFFGILLYLLSRADVSLVWPLTSLGFVITALAARFYLHEHVSPMRWAGVVLIVVGAGLVSWSEQTKGPSGPPPVRGDGIRSTP